MGGKMNEMRSEITYLFWLSYVVFSENNISYLASHLIFHRF